MKKIILLICCIFLLSGCYDYKELNDRSIVSSIGIDYKDGKYIVNLEITKSSNDNNSTEIKTQLVSGESKNIVDAFTNAKNKSDKMVYMEHVEVLILSKTLCEKGINDVLDYIIRDQMINNNYFVVVADDPKGLIELSFDNKSTAEVIVDTVKYYYENTTIDDLDIVASNIMNKRDDVALPYVYMEEENVVFNEVAYFNEDKMKGLINNKMYNFLKLDSVNVNFSNNGNTISIYKKDIGYEVKNNKVNIKIKVLGAIKDINDDINLKDTKIYRRLEKNISETIKKETTEFIDETLKNKADLLGLEDKYYKKYKKDMNSIKYNVEVELSINRNGTIYGGAI